MTTQYQCAVRANWLSACCLYSGFKLTVSGLCIGFCLYFIEIGFVLLKRCVFQLQNLKLMLGNKLITPAQCASLRV